jgi:copper homeostasis protein (lipoprotein)
MRRTLFELIACLSVGMAGCRASEPGPASAPSTTSPATSAVSTVRYAGTLPCADCAGIRTELSLSTDAAGQPTTYELKQTYLGTMSADGEKPQTTNGRWSQEIRSAAGQEMTIVVLDGGGKPQEVKSFERVTDGELRMLDRSQQRIQSTVPYSLARVTDLTLSFSPSAPGTTPPAAGAGAVSTAAMVTDLATGWPLSLRVGQQLTARLSANPSTGYRWALRSGSDGGIVAVQGAATFEQGGAPAPGSPGVEVFHLKAVKAGKADVTFDYKRPSDTAPSRSVSYPVTVQ